MTSTDTRSTSQDHLKRVLESTNEYEYFEVKEIQEEDGDNDDAELEELVERSVRRFIGIGSSHSAHANLAQMVSFKGFFLLF